MRGTAWDILQVNNEATFARHCARVFDIFAPQKSLLANMFANLRFIEIKVHSSPYPQLLKVFVQITATVLAQSPCHVMAWALSCLKKCCGKRCLGVA